MLRNPFRKGDWKGPDGGGGGCMPSIMMLAGLVLAGLVALFH